MWANVTECVSGKHFVIVLYCELKSINFYLFILFESILETYR